MKETLRIDHKYAQPYVTTMEQKILKTSSPIIPILVHSLPKIYSFSRRSLDIYRYIFFSLFQCIVLYRRRHHHQHGNKWKENCLNYHRRRILSCFDNNDLNDIFLLMRNGTLYYMNVKVLHTRRNSLAILTEALFCEYKWNVYNFTS